MAEHNPILDQVRNSAASPTAAVDSTDKLVAVQEALATSTTRIVSSIQDLESGAKQTQLATDVIKTATADITSANQITARARGNADLQAQNATIDAFEASGGVEIQSTLMAALAVDNKRVAGILEERTELANEDRFGEGISLLDNIINQFNINLTNTQLRAATAQRDNTVSQISNISGATESFARVNALTKKTLNEGVIEANYKAIAAEGSIKAAEAEIRNINSNATAMSQLVSADSRNVSNLIQGFRLEGEAQERELKQERMKFQREQMTFSREQWKVQLPATKVALEQAELNLERSKKLSPTQILAAEQTLASAQKRFNDQITTENTLVSSVQAAQSLLGTGVEDKETILFGLKNTGTAGARYDKLLELGAVQNPVLGSTPFDAKESVSIAAPSGNIAPTKGLAILDQVTTLQAAKYKQPGAKLPKDRATVAADFNRTAGELIASFTASISTGDNSNPYHAPPMSVLADMIAVKNTSLYQLVLKPMGMKETDPQRIVDAAIAGVVAKTISPEAAATGISVLFETAALYNNTLNGGFSRVGLPNQTTYNSSIKIPATAFQQLTGTGKGLLFNIPEIARAGTAFPVAVQAIIQEADTRLGIVDMMDTTKVQELIVKVLSSNPPKVSTPKLTNNPEQQGE